MNKIDVIYIPTHGTKAEWETVNPLVPEGALCTETDTGKIKVGDGKRRWREIPYAIGEQGPRGLRGLKGEKGEAGTISSEQLAQLVKNESGVQKLKFENGKLYIFDGETWHESKGGGEGVGEGVVADGEEFWFDGDEIIKTLIVDTYIGTEEG